MDAKGRLCIPVLWRRRELNYRPKASNSNKVAGAHEICAPICAPKLRGDYFLPFIWAFALAAAARFCAGVIGGLPRFFPYVPLPCGISLAPFLGRLSTFA